MHNKILKLVHEIFKKVRIDLNLKKFKWLNINLNQSLGYQLMVIMMHIHKLKRHNIVNYCDYEGKDTLYITNNDWKKISIDISKTISKNYKNFIKSYTHEEIENYYFDILQNTGKDYSFELSEVEGYLYEFKMEEKGYAYQFNGYIRKEQKLQETANLIALVVGYFSSVNWLIGKKYINLETDILYLVIVSGLLGLIYIFRHQSWIIKFILLTCALSLIIA